MSYPVPLVFRLFFWRFNSLVLGRAVFGAGVLVASVTQGGLEVSWQNAVLSGMAARFGIGTLASLIAIVGGTALWFERSDQAVFMLLSLFRFAYYPLDFYPALLRGLFLTVLPLGAVAYLPALLLLGKGTGLIPLFMSAGLFALTASAAALLWRQGLRHYQGA